MSWLNRGTLPDTLKNPYTLALRMDDAREGHEYEDYEVTIEDRASVKEIERCLRDERYQDHRQVRDHLDFLETLEARCAEALAIERSIGRSNYTLRHDHEKVQELMRRLKELLDNKDRLAL